MQRDGWVSIASEKEIFLTEVGQAAAMSVIKRHMLTEWMLSRMLKLPLSELHREAHHIEHTLSAEVADRIRVEMDGPRVCLMAILYPVLRMKFNNGCRFQKRPRAGSDFDAHSRKT